MNSSIAELPPDLDSGDDSSKFYGFPRSAAENVGLTSDARDSRFKSM